MTGNSAYDVRSIAKTPEQEIKRLNGQVDLFWAKEARLLQSYGAGAAKSVLDCGCGPGYYISRLVDLFPGMAVTGIDVDPYLVSEAMKQAGSLPNVSLSTGSILEIPAAANTFDLVISRLVLEHLPDPALALLEVLRVLKPNGRAVFLNNDFDYHPRTYPDIPELDDLYRVYCNARTEEHGNPRIGRQLPVLLKAAGFEEVDFELLCAHSSITGDEAFVRSEGSGIAGKLVSTGHLAADTYRAMTFKWMRMMRHDGHAIVRQLCVCSGVKP